MMIKSIRPKSWSIPKFDIKDPSLVLFLPLWYPYSDMTGSTIYSYDVNRYVATVTGTVLGSQGRTFDGDDYIQLTSDDSILDFTSGAFTIIVWNKPTTIDGFHKLIARGGYQADGYDFDFDVNGAVRFYTNQVGAAQFTTSNNGNSVVDTWSMVSAVRSGASVTLYKNTTDITDNPGVHINPTSAGLGLLIGIDADKIGHGQKGIIGEVSIYNRALSLAEITQIYNVTKFRYV